MRIGHLLKKRVRKGIEKVGQILNPDQTILKELYYSVLFNQVILDSKWVKDKTFTPGRWAVDYCFLYTMYRALETFNPQNILDIGLGQTTKMLSQYVKYKESEGVKLLTVEHDNNWVDFYKKTSIEVESDVRILEFKRNVPYQLTNEVAIDNSNIYAGFEELIQSCDAFDFVTVDGPPLYNEKFNRFQILDLLKNDRLANDFVIMVDDLDCKGEQNTVNLFLFELGKRGVKCVSKIYEGSKKHCLITTEKYKFLTTL